MTYDYGRYLAAKRTVDDRALNGHVLATLRQVLPTPRPRVLEVGGGVGTMIGRLLERGVIRGGDYTLLDVDSRLLGESRGWLAGWAKEHGAPFEERADGCLVGELRVRLCEAALAEHLRGPVAEFYDLLVAHAFLDLVDVDEAVPALLRRLAPGGVYWFTLTYDGETILLPEHPADQAVLGAYHRDMDRRVRDGVRAGDSRTGRHLFAPLYAAGAGPLAAGASDWVVHPSADGGYPHDEAYFLGCILDTVGAAGTVLADVAPAELAAWLEARRRQLVAGELVYVAHQLDVVGVAPTPQE